MDDAISRVLELEEEQLSDLTFDFSTFKTQLCLVREAVQREIVTLTNTIKETRAALVAPFAALDEDKSAQYTLFAAWVHSGPTPGAGHYW